MIVWAAERDHARLELGVVLFKNSHYFTISNVWNSTIQELVLFKCSYKSRLYGISSPPIISHFTAQRFCYEHSLFKSQRFCLRFQYFSYIFAQPWTFFTFLSLMISVDVFSLSTNRDKLRIISNVVFVAKFSNLAIKRCKELGLKITRSLCTEFTFAW